MSGVISRGILDSTHAQTSLSPALNLKIIIKRKEEIMRNHDPFLTTYQLARRWKINTATLRQWRWFNKGPKCQKVGGRALYRIEVIERFENELLRAHTTDKGQTASKSIP